MAVAAIVMSGVMASVAIGIPVPTPDCWQDNCVDTNTQLACEQCCIEHCANQQPYLCQTWCADRVYSP